MPSIFVFGYVRGLDTCIYLVVIEWKGFHLVHQVDNELGQLDTIPNTLYI